MNLEDFDAALLSSLPSVRMQAVQWAIENTLPSEYESILVKAASGEGVPRVRSAMSIALRQFSRPILAEETYNAHEGKIEIASLLDDLSGIIRHEMQPAIGWIRHAAKKEIPDFEASATNTATEALLRRVRGLSDLAAAHRLPSRESVSLSEIVSKCISTEYPASMFSLDSVDQPSDDILTDPGLLTLVLANAVQNAADASRDLPPGEGQILISTNVNEKRFWLTISNRFVGASFELSGVSASGRTTKRGHRGLGTRIIELATSRLGYEFDLKAAGATATFSLRGNRFA